MATKSNNDIRQVRHARVRSRLRGTASTPRLSVFRGLKAVTAQLVDDTAGKTLCFVKSSDLKKIKSSEGQTGKVAAAYATGLALAEKAKALGITKAVFDRGGYSYHGRVAAVAEGARAGGLAL
ncbi:MAG: 50S ribosomal protein L18 [Candidatus Magasanikbacteria bacterium]|nr:50S ribosomal protein L18 [Candidatus Magasanikbacteria bacterium]